MNNNNRGNNRRRGRGSNNNRQQGGGQHVNRIDSRARGNAPQMLEKYRKLAHDAHLNGDRVTEEYNLQFADHYFRVIADQRQRQDEQRTRRDGPWQEGGEPERERDENDLSADYGSDDYTAYDQPHRREREDRPQRQDDRPERPERAERPERSERPERAERAERGERPERGERGERPQRAERPERDSEPRGESNDQAAGDNAGGDDTAAQRSPYEPPENPFVRENRGTRGLRPRREDRRPRREADEAETGNEAPASFDASLLPPAISAPREEVAEAPATEAEAEAKPRRTRAPRRPRPPADDAGETLEQVG